MATDKAVLEDIRDRIKDPEHWTCGAYARNALDQPCSELSNTAVSWCALGSMMRTFNDLSVPAGQRDRVFYSLYRIAQDMRSTIMGVNDAQGHTQTLRMLNIAIEECEQAVDIDD